MARVEAEKAKEKIVKEEKNATANWVCGLCTFAENPCTIANCSVCQNPRGSSDSRGAGATGEWTCSVCTLLNGSDKHECAACSTERPRSGV